MTSSSGFCDANLLILFSHFSQGTPKSQEIERKARGRSKQPSVPRVFPDWNSDQGKLSYAMVTTIFLALGQDATYGLTTGRHAQPADRSHAGGHPGSRSCPQAQHSAHSDAQSWRCGEVTGPTASSRLWEGPPRAPPGQAEAQPGTRKSEGEHEGR